MPFLLRRILLALGDPPSELRVVLLLAAVLAYGTTGLLFFEGPDRPELGWLDCLWWTLVTLTTVGYGDFFPTTVGGRFVVAVPVMVVGIGLLGYVLSFAASSLVEAKGRELRGMTRTKLAGHLIIVNFPSVQKVSRVALELRHPTAFGRGLEIVLVDEDLTELPAELVSLGLRFVRGNPARDETLERASVDDASQAIVLVKRPGDPNADHQNLAIALAIEGRNRRVHTVVECVDASSEELLRKAGADSIVCTSRFESHFLTSEALNPGAQDVVDELLSRLRGQLLFFTALQTEGVPFGRVAAVCRERGHLAIGLRREGGALLNVDESTPVKRGDDLITIGPGPLDSLRA